MLGWCSKKRPGQKPPSCTWNILPATMCVCLPAQPDEGGMASAGATELRAMRPWGPESHGAATGGRLKHGLSGAWVCCSICMAPGHMMAHCGCHCSPTDNYPQPVWSQAEPQSMQLHHMGLKDKLSVSFKMTNYRLHGKMPRRLF